MLSSLTDTELRARYDLLARSTDPEVAEFRDDRQAILAGMQTLVKDGLSKLGQRFNPDGFTQLYQEFLEELSRFSDFCAYPDLSHRATAAFAGGFSAGKSSTINALLDTKGLMPVNIDPTTSLPAYVLGGEQDEIFALNLFGNRIRLSAEEFSSLTHDEKEQYGTQVARLLRVSFVVRSNFPWPRLAFIDTPGYSGGTELQGGYSDLERALAQLDAAQAVVWVSSIKQGIISESDLQILAKLRPDQPRIVLLSRADSVTESDREDVVNKVKETLETRNIAVHGVWPVSTRRSLAHLLDPVREYLSQWNGLATDPRFAYRFKTLFYRFRKGIEVQRKHLHGQRYHLNRLSTVLSEDEILLEDMEALRRDAERRVASLDLLLTHEQEIESQFFAALQGVGKILGIPMPAPEDLELIELEPISLLDRLQAVAEDWESLPPVIHRSCLAALLIKSDPPRMAAILRKKTFGTDTLLSLTGTGRVENKTALIRRKNYPLKVLEALVTPSPISHRNLLLREFSTPG